MNWPSVLIGGAIGAAITLIAGLVFYWLTIRRSTPSVAFKSSSSPVITRSEQEVGDLEVRFKGETVPRLTRTRMAIWNPRWTVIESADIAESDPLRIIVLDAQVLDVQVTAETREAVSFKSEVRDGVCYLGFDFLDRHDGVMLDVLHTGSDTARPSIQGIIKGVPAGVAYFGELVSQPRPRQREQGLGDAAVGLLSGFLGGLILTLIAATGHHETSDLVKEWGAAGFLYAVMLGSFAVLWSRRVPRGLRQNREQPVGSGRRVLRLLSRR